MLKRLVMAAFLLISATTQYSFAQIETALTIGAVRDLISNALRDLQSVTVTAGGEIQGAGNQLQANAQNVIRDIDSAFKNNLNLTFDKMDQQQRALYRDAQSLAKQLASISAETLTRGGYEARRAIAEADIAAYNTSYNLPCRDQNSRVVYAVPDRLRIGKDTPELSIRGNYLAFGDKADIKVAGTTVSPISRNHSEIRVRIPQAILDNASAELSIPIEVNSPNQTKNSFLFFWCPEKIVPGKGQSASVTLLPVRKIEVKAEITPTILAPESRTISHRFDTGAPGDCGVDQDVSKQICSADGWAVESSSLTDVSVNGGCGSSAGPTSASGNACVHVPGRLRGCGWGFGAFGIRDCRGRGWVSWTLNVVEKRMAKKEAKSQEFNIKDSTNSSFTFRYSGASELNAPTWSYFAQVTISEGDKKSVHEISNAGESAGPVSGRLVDGALSIAIAE